MKIKRLSGIAACVAFVVITVVTLGMLHLSPTIGLGWSHANELGLTGSDLEMGGHPGMDALRASTRAAADSFLAQHTNDLTDASEGIHELAVDFSKSPKIRSLGYKSSFYYHCWDIYLPYSLRTQSGKTNTVVVHLSDDGPAHKHNPERFWVIDATLLDDQGQSIKKVDGRR